MPDIEALVRERAYLIWEKTGKPLGRDTDHWFQAAREIADENGKGKARKPLKPTAVETMPPRTETAPPKRGRSTAGTLFRKK